MCIHTQISSLARNVNSFDTINKKLNHVSTKLIIMCIRLYFKLVLKTKSYELRDHNSSCESNDHSSPDSGSVSLSSGVESNGHFDENLVDTSGHPDSSPIQKRFVRNNSGGNEMMMQPAQHFQTVKKVAFYDHPHLVPISIAPVSHQERMNGPILHRSYTFDQGELNHHYMAAMNMKIQRTNSYSYGRGVPPQMQYSTFPRSQYPVHHQSPPHYSGINFAPSSDHHRLPRVHRGLAYENSVIHGVPQPNYPPPPPLPHRMSQHHNQTSAFKQVKTREGGRQNQYENVVQQHHPQEHRNGGIFSVVQQHHPQEHRNGGILSVSLLKSVHIHDDLKIKM